MDATLTRLQKRLCRRAEQRNVTVLCVLMSVEEMSLRAELIMHCDVAMATLLTWVGSYSIGTADECARYSDSIEATTSRAAAERRQAPSAAVQHAAACCCSSASVMWRKKHEPSSWPACTQ